MIEDALTTLLTDAPGTANAGRIYPDGGAPQAVSLPYVTIAQVSEDPFLTHDGYDETRDQVYQISAWAKSQAAAKAEGEAIRKTLAFYTGTAQGYAIQAIYFEDLTILQDSTSKEFQAAGTYRVVWDDPA